jgi:predicted nucleic acid-binding protein
MSSSWICVDANLVVRLVVSPDDKAVQAVWAQWDASEQQLAAPTLLYYEVTNALYSYQKMGMMSLSLVQLALETTLALPLVLYGEPDLHRRAVQLANHLSLPAAYDAHYLALAEHLDGEFWTADGALVRTVQHAFPWVRLVE